jgi:phosphate transport system permease protein
MKIGLFSRSSPSNYPSAIEDLGQVRSLEFILEKGFIGLVWLCGFSLVFILFWLTWIVFDDAKPAIEAYGWQFLVDRDWNVGEEKFGGLPYIYGTIVTSILALCFAIPLGIAVAIITSEDLLPNWVKVPISSMVELIAAIPSVIVGLWGIFVFLPIFKPLQLWLYQNLAEISLFGKTVSMPLFSTEPFGPSMLAAGVLLSVMILPTIAAIGREVFLAVPPELRSASMALGATRWETIWRTILPAASSGLVGGIILALGRALGETIAVTMVIGNSNFISASLLDPAYTIPAVLANQFAEAIGEKHIGALMYLALVLFAITSIVNAIAIIFVYYVNKNRR